MPWIVRTKYEPPHECPLPSLEPIEDSTLAGPGSVWMCEECQLAWLVSLVDGKLAWEGPSSHLKWAGYHPDNAVDLRGEVTGVEVNWATHGVPAPNINPELLKEGNR